MGATTTVAARSTRSGDRAGAGGGAGGFVGNIACSKRGREGARAPCRIIVLTRIAVAPIPAAIQRVAEREVDWVLTSMPRLTAGPSPNDPSTWSAEETGM